MSSLSEPAPLAVAPSPTASPLLSASPLVDLSREPEVPSTWAEVWTQPFEETTRTVLDVGTGSGKVALLLTNLGYEVTGIEPSGRLLDQARRKLTDHPHPPELRQGDTDAPPFDPSSFDALVARYELWTLPDLTAALTVWHSQLRPGGVLVAVDGPGTTDEGIGPVLAALELAGFEQVRAELLPDILELDLAGARAPDHRPGRQYRFTARSPR